MTDQERIKRLERLFELQQKQVRRLEEACKGLLAIAELTNPEAFAKCKPIKPTLN